MPSKEDPPEPPIPPSPGPSEPGPTEALIAKARQILATTGRQTILVYVRQDGREFPQQIRLANVDAIDDLATKIFERFGSGDFDYRIRVGGAFACGWLPISIADDPLDEEEEGDEDLDEEPEDEAEEEECEPPLSRAEILEEAVALMEQRQADRLRADEQERAREHSIQAPLLARIGELERLIKSIQTPAAPPPPSPELVALKQTVEILATQLQAKERDAQKTEQSALEERVTKRLDEIQAALSAPKKKRTRDPIESALAQLTKIAVVDKTLETLKARASHSEDGEGSGLLEQSISIFEKPLRSVMEEAAKELERTAKKSLRQGSVAANGSNGATSSPQDDVPGDLIPWLQLVFKQQQRVLDVEFVRASLAKSAALSASLERLATCTSVEQLYAAANDLLGPSVLDAIKKEGPDYSKGILQLCAALARSIQAAKTTPPPPAEKEKTA